MTKITKKYLLPKPSRDVVFVLGAGASHADGVPLSRHILPMILKENYPEINNSEIGKSIKKFIEDNFNYPNKQGTCPQLEAVFGFFDYFLFQNESLSSTYTNSEIYALKEHLIKLIHYVVNLKVEKRSSFYHSLWDSINRFNRNVSFITLNYDTLLEESFSHLFPQDGFIDYCVHFMNYSKTEKLKDFNFWINPREPVECGEMVDPAVYKIIKLHGSLNWKYCNCCNQTLLTPWDKKIDLNRGNFLGYTYPEKKVYRYYCPNDETDFQTLILPPSYIKSLKQPVISQLFSEASRELMVSKKIVFIGYSLSNSDVHIKALFKKHLNNNNEIIVINRRNSETLKEHYYALSKNIQFIDCSFEHLVKDKNLLKSILC